MIHFNKILVTALLIFGFSHAMQQTRPFSLDTVDPKSVITLFHAITSLPLYIPKSLLVESGGDRLRELLKTKPNYADYPLEEYQALREKYSAQLDSIHSNMEELLKKYGVTENYNMRDSYGTISERNDPLVLERSEHPEILFQGEHQYIKDKDNLYLSLDKMPQLLRDAKTIIRAFLPQNNTEQESIVAHPSDYIQKESAIDRMFTYANLHREIKRKQLTQVSLPRKFLLIKDNKTGRFLSPQEASKVIDTYIKIKGGVFSFAIDTADDSIFADESPYKLVIFAQKVPKFTTGGLSPATMNQLKLLCDAVPFDIGFDNIFWDAKGAAIIIDTEKKSTHSRDCGKLDRYPVQ